MHREFRMEAMAGQAAGPCSRADSGSRGGRPLHCHVLASRRSATTPLRVAPSHADTGSRGGRPPHCQKLPAISNPTPARGSFATPAAPLWDPGPCAWLPVTASLSLARWRLRRGGAAERVRRCKLRQSGCAARHTLRAQGLPEPESRQAGRHICRRWRLMRHGSAGARAADRELAAAACVRLQRALRLEQAMCV